MTFTLPPWRGRKRRPAPPRDPNPDKLPPDQDAERRQLGLPGVRERPRHAHDDEHRRSRRR